MSNNRLKLAQELFTAYEFSDLAQKSTQLNSLENSLTIGVIGEFSAGKSSLINAMLGKSQLPALERPTTTAIVEIHPSVNCKELQYFQLGKDEKLAPISVLDFDEIVLNNPDERILVLQTPVSPLLPAGYTIIDTPGIQSLEQSHTDITCGYLPKLDGAIICQDINKGNLTQSLKDFLNQESVRPFLDKIIFVFTRSDTKAPADIVHICSSFVEDITRFYAENKLNVTNIAQRVFALSPKKMLAGEAEEDKTRLQKAFADIFIAKRQEMAKARLAIENDKIIADLTQRLWLVCETLKLDRSQYAAKQAEINQDIESVTAKKEQCAKGLVYAKSRVEEKIRVLIMQQAATLMEVDAKSIPSILGGIFDEAMTLAYAEIKPYFSDFALHSKIGGDYSNLVGRINKINSFANAGTEAGNLAISIAIALSTGGASLAANAVETMGVKAIFGKVLEKVNPVDIIADMASKHFKEEAIKEELTKLTVHVTNNVLEKLDAYLENDFFAPQRNALKAANKQIDKLLQDEKLDENTINTQRKQLEAKIVLLNNA